MDRIHWHQLPHAARWAVTECTGAIHSATPVTDGANSAIAVRLTTDTGDYFVKGIPTDHPKPPPRTAK